jgi:hypothetical protein
MTIYTFTRSSQLGDPQTLLKMKSYYNEYDYKRRSALMDMGFFFLRRAVFVAIIMLINDVPSVQLIVSFLIVIV